MQVSPKAKGWVSCIPRAPRRDSGVGFLPVARSATLPAPMWIRQIPTYFLRGALTTVPIALTLYVLYLIFTTIDQWLPFGVPGLGVIATLGFITLVGFLSSNVIGSTVVGFAERMLGKVPLVKLIYSSLKDLIDAFVGERKRFDTPVAVRFSKDSPIRGLGFVTRRDLSCLGYPGHVAVYFPQSYNFAGNVVVVPTQLVERLDVPSGELMTFVVSGGVSGLGVGQSIIPPEPMALPPAPETQDV